MVAIYLQDSVVERLAKSAEAQGLTVEGYLESLALGGLNHEREFGECLPFVASEGDSDISWAEVRAITAKFSSSLTADFERERDERF